MTKPCQECGAPFEARGNMRYCSKACAKAGQRRRGREWRRRNEEATRAWRKANPAKVALYKRKSRLKEHGLTLEGFDLLLKSQGGKCALCETREAKAVDHCHETGRVRGLLCVMCNVAVGVLGDTPDRIARVLEYVSNPTQKRKVA